MAYTKSSDNTSVSNIFIDEYMPGADGNFVKVYLLGLSRCGSGEVMTREEIAKKLGISPDEVIAAWKYWQNRGAVVLKPNNVDFDVDFVDLKALKNRLHVEIETKPTYTPDEVYSEVSSNITLQEMYKTVERILDKPLSTNDITVIYGFYDYYRLPIDVIPLMVSYAVGSGRHSMRYIDKVAQSWADKGIDTFEKATKYLEKAEEYNSKLKKLMRAIGIYDRRLTETEQKFMSKWINEFKFPNDIITYAYDIAATNTGKFSVKYMDKILQDWYTSGVKTIKDAEQHRAGFRQRKNETARPTQNSNKFNNFSQPSADYSTLEALGFTKNKRTGE